MEMFVIKLSVLEAAKEELKRLAENLEQPHGRRCGEIELDLDLLIAQLKCLLFADQIVREHMKRIGLQLAAGEHSHVCSRCGAIYTCWNPYGDSKAKCMEEILPICRKCLDLKDEQ